MTKIEQYDDDICRLRWLLDFPCLTYDYKNDLWKAEFDQQTGELLIGIMKREVERLTAERNNLIRLGGY